MSDLDERLDEVARLTFDEKDARIAELEAQLQQAEAEKDEEKDQRRLIQSTARTLVNQWPQGVGELRWAYDQAEAKNRELQQEYQDEVANAELAWHRVREQEATIARLRAALLDGAVPVNSYTTVVACSLCGAVARREDRALANWHKDNCHVRAALTPTEDA